MDIRNQEAEQLCREVFKEPLEELERKMETMIMESIKLFPKSQVGYIRNRLEVKLRPEIILKVKKRRIINK